jgi:hypothetical protein
VDEADFGDSIIAFLRLFVCKLFAKKHKKAAKVYLEANCHSQGMA